jgi:hypothetical protein
LLNSCRMVWLSIEKVNGTHLIILPVIRL